MEVYAAVTSLAQFTPSKLRATPHHPGAVRFNHPKIPDSCQQEKEKRPNRSQTVKSAILTQTGQPAVANRINRLALLLAITPLRLGRYLPARAPTAHRIIKMRDTRFHLSQRTMSHSAFRALPLAVLPYRRELATVRSKPWPIHPCNLSKVFTPDYLASTTTALLAFRFEPPHQHP